MMNNEISSLAKSLVRSKHSAAMTSDDSIGFPNNVDNDFHVRTTPFYIDLYAFYIRSVCHFYIRSLCLFHSSLYLLHINSMPFNYDFYYVFYIQNLCLLFTISMPFTYDLYVFYKKQ